MGEIDHPRMMDAETKAKWLEALRSGRYRQGAGVLRNAINNTFCCLGVLADVVDPDGWGGTTEIGESSAQLHSSNCLTVLTNEFARSLGLPNGNPDTDVDGKSLAELNDSGVSFKGIADIIERNF